MGRFWHLESDVQVTVHGMAVKYGGKFVDFFLKCKFLTILVFYVWGVFLLLGMLKLWCSAAFDFLQAHFQTHNETIIQLVRLDLPNFIFQAWLEVSFLEMELKSWLCFVYWFSWRSSKRPQEQYRFYVLKQRFPFHISICSKTSLHLHYYSLM